jgi:hypothetical protein
MKKLIAVVAALLTLLAATAAMAAAPSRGSYTYKVIAWNDLGMHCVCPGFDTFMLLPPYNTVRAQVFAMGGTDPVMVDSTFALANGLSISYAMVENTDANLQLDPNFQSWIKNSPKLFPGFQPIVGGKVMGLAGKGLAGTMDYNATLINWKADGIPAYPNLDANGAMTDPTGGPNRNPYLTGNVYVKDATGKVLAQTSTVVPAAFGGCCGCHLRLASANGYTADPSGSFKYMGVLHARTSKINFSYIDVDGDGVGGPVRCSWCHVDPAMGESVAPGVPAGYKILAGAGFTTADVKTSQYSFSDVLHRYHSQSTVVLTQYDANIANNCYDCHPGNGINCYRGAHKGKTAIWCSDCHGNLNQRVATNQMKQPWSQSTLPSCSAPSPGITSAFACHPTSIATGNASAGLFGKFLNGRGHKGSVDCETCHGEPHALAPSTLAKDNVQLQTLQGSTAYSFPAGKDKSYALGVCNFCHSAKTTTWGVPPHLGKQAM